MVLAIALVVLQSPVPKWQDPPGEETKNIKALIDGASQDLDQGKSISAILSNTKFDEARPYPRFREQIKKHADDRPVTMVAATESGEPIDLTMKLPKPGLLVYLYHTDGRGAYGKNGVHIQANSGDIKHARLFAYAKTDPNGKAVFHTVRPMGYPNGELPQHFHFGIQPGTPAVGEIWFEDDPRLTPPWRERARQGAAVVAKPRRVGGRWKVEIEIRWTP